MGIIQVPNIEAYWSTAWTSEIFSRVLRRDRFQQLFWLLHVSHDDSDVPLARINKVKALLDLLVPNFQESYTPSQDISVDETMVGFRRPFGAKQYRNSLFFRCKNIFVQRKCTKFFYANIILQRKIFRRIFRTGTYVRSNDAVAGSRD